MIVIHSWGAWDKNQKMILKNKIMVELPLRITWGFTRNLELWWSRWPDQTKLDIIQDDKLVES